LADSSLSKSRKRQLQPPQRLHCHSVPKTKNTNRENSPVANKQTVPSSLQKRNPLARTSSTDRNITLHPTEELTLLPPRDQVRSDKLYLHRYGADSIRFWLKKDRASTGKHTNSQAIRAPHSSFGRCNCSVGKPRSAKGTRRPCQSSKSKLVAGEPKL